MQSHFLYFLLILYPLPSLIFQTNLVICNNSSLKCWFYSPHHWKILLNTIFISSDKKPEELYRDAFADEHLEHSDLLLKHERDPSVEFQLSL